MAELKEILSVRGNLYGDFTDQAVLSQALKYRVMPKSTVQDWEAYQLEAMEMILHKISRISNGDPNYADSWRDIAGYATLVADRLEFE
jgi:hypothetical protein